MRTTALAFLKRMYEKDQLRDYIEKFALNYLQLLVHPNPPSLLFGADKDTGLFITYLTYDCDDAIFTFLPQCSLHLLTQRWLPPGLKRQ